MPNREDIIREETFSEFEDEVARRVLYTINDKDGKFAADRTQRAVSLLVELLHQKGMIDNDELDEYLLGVISKA